MFFPLKHFRGCNFYDLGAWSWRVKGSSTYFKQARMYFQLDPTESQSWGDFEQEITTYLEQLSTNNEQVKFVFHFVLKKLDEFLIDGAWDNVEDISDEFLDVPQHHEFISQNVWMKKRKKFTSKRVELSYKKYISNTKNIFIYEDVPEEKFSEEINATIKACQAFATIQFTRFTKGNIYIDSCCFGEKPFPDYYLICSIQFTNIEELQASMKQLNISEDDILEPVPSKIVEYLDLYKPEVLQHTRDKSIVRSISYFEKYRSMFHRYENPFQGLNPNADDQTVIHWIQKKCQQFNQKMPTNVVKMKGKELYKSSPQQLIEKFHDQTLCAVIYFEVHAWEAVESCTKEDLIDQIRDNPQLIQYLKLKDLEWIAVLGNVDGELLGQCCAQADLLHDWDTLYANIKYNANTRHDFYNSTNSFG